MRPPRSPPTPEKAPFIHRAILKLCIKLGASYFFTAAFFHYGLHVLRRQGLSAVGGGGNGGGGGHGGGATGGGDGLSLVTSEHDSQFAVIAATSHTVCLAMGYSSATFLRGRDSEALGPVGLVLLCLWPPAFAVVFFMWLRSHFLSGRGWINDKGRAFFYGQGSSSFGFVASFAYCGCIGLAWFLSRTSTSSSSPSSGDEDSLTGRSRKARSWEGAGRGGGRGVRGGDGGTATSSTSTSFQPPQSPKSPKSPKSPQSPQSPQTPRTPMGSPEPLRYALGSLRHLPEDGWGSSASLTLRKVAPAALRQGLIRIVACFVALFLLHDVRETERQRETERKSEGVSESETEAETKTKTGSLVALESVQENGLLWFTRAVGRLVFAHPLPHPLPHPLLTRDSPIHPRYPLYPPTHYTGAADPHLGPRVPLPRRRCSPLHWMDPLWLRPLPLFGRSHEPLPHLPHLLPLLPLLLVNTASVDVDAGDRGGGGGERRWWNSEGVYIELRSPRHGITYVGHRGGDPRVVHEQRAGVRTGG